MIDLRALRRFAILRIVVVIALAVAVVAGLALLFLLARR